MPKPFIGSRGNFFWAGLKGSDNKVADALSHVEKEMEGNSPTLLTLTSVPIMELLSRIMEHYNLDLVASQLYGPRLKGDMSEILLEVVISAKGSNPKIHYLVDSYNHYPFPLDLGSTFLWTS